MIWESKENWLEAANAAGVEGFLHFLEAEKLVELAEGRDVLEIGSYRGLSAWCMAHSAKSITCVDTFRAWTNGQTQNTEEEGLTTLDAFLDAMKGFSNVSHIVGTSKYAGRKLKRHFDMIFLDANHEYEEIRRDIAKWWPRVKPGGVLALHDYGHDAYPGVKRAADEAFGDLGPYAPNTDQQWIVTLRWEVKSDRRE